MTKPIYDAVSEYAKKSPSRFHMPSHFGEDLDGGLYASAAFDITELPFSDNLQNPDGIIAESERQCARSYGAKRSLYFTTGASAAVFTAVAAVKTLTDEIILPRASHKSLYAAARLFGLKPRYIPPRFYKGIPLPVTAEEVEAAIREYPLAGAVAVTSPNYFGMTADADKICDVIKKHKKLLIADEAHGAHFPFSTLFPKGFSGVADLCAVSLHKTLPVYTGGAVLNVNNESLFDITTALRADLHTTSPSYVVLASMDYALDDLREKGGILYDGLYARVEKLKKDIPDLTFLNNDDFTRLAVLTGRKNAEALYNKDIIPEAVFGDWCVFILSPRNADKLDALESGLRMLRFDGRIIDTPDYPAPVEGVSGTDCGFVSLDKAVGRTSHREVGVYPPGIPLVAAGEIITAEAAKILAGENTFGFVNNKICVTIDNSK